MNVSSRSLKSIAAVSLGPISAYVCSYFCDLDLDLDLQGEDLDLDSGGKDLDLNFEDLTTSLPSIDPRKTAILVFRVTTGMENLDVMEHGEKSAGK